MVLMRCTDPVKSSSPLSLLDQGAESLNGTGIKSSVAFFVLIARDSLVVDGQVRGAYATQWIYSP